jgi:hypothetical protein
MTCTYCIHYTFLFKFIIIIIIIIIINHLLLLFCNPKFKKLNSDHNYFWHMLVWLHFIA